MAQALPVIGSAVGMFFGGPLGAAVGNYIGTQAMWAITPAQKFQGPRLKDLTVTNSSYGNQIPILFGAMRTGGNIFWSSGLREVATKNKQGGKGGGPKSETTTYTYYASWAVALCRGEVTHLNKVWFDEVLVYDSSNPKSAIFGKLRFYSGSEDQQPDSIIQANVGSENTPAYRGICYVVFDDILLEKYGNRIPNVSCEIIRPVGGVGGLDSQIADLVRLESGSEKWYCPGAQYDSAGVRRHSQLEVDFTSVGPGPCRFILRGYKEDGSDPVVILDTTVDTRPYPGLDLSLYYQPFSIPSASTKPALPVLLLSGSPRAAVIVRNNSVGSRFWLITVTASGVTFSDIQADVDYVAAMSPVSYLCSSEKSPGKIELLYGVDGQNIRACEISGGTMSHGQAIPVKRRLYGTDSPSLDQVCTVCPLRDAPGTYIADVPAGYGGPYVSTKAMVTFTSSGVVSSAQYPPLRRTIAGYAAAFAYGQMFVPTTRIYTDFGVSAAYAAIGINFASGSISDPTESPSYVRSINTPYNLTGHSSDKIWCDTGGLGVHTSVGEKIVVSTIGPTSIYLSFGTPSYIRYSVDRFNIPTTDLAAIVSELCSYAGVTDVDVSDISGTPVHGFLQDTGSSARDAIAPLQQAFFFDGVEINGKIVFRFRGKPSSHTITYDQLGAAEGEGDQDFITITRAQDSELPKKVVVSYVDPTRRYEVSSQYDSRAIETANIESSLELPIAMSATDSKRIAVKTLYEAWLSRESIEVKCSSEDIALILGAPTLTIQDNEGDEFVIRVVGVDFAAPGLLTVRGAIVDSRTYKSEAEAFTPPLPDQEVDLLPATTEFEIIDAPLLLDGQRDDGILIAPYVVDDGSWKSCVVLLSYDGGVTYEAVASSDTRAVVGEVLASNLTPSDGLVPDLGSRASVRMLDGALDSVTEEQALYANANAALIGDEVVTFAYADETSPGEYELSIFSRGRKGTEPFSASHTAGERFVMLDSQALIFVPLSQDRIGQTIHVKVATSGQQLDDVDSKSFIYSGNAYRCWAPSNLSIDSAAGSSYTFTWNRRSRKGGEWRDLVDVPLHEDSEGYDVRLDRGLSIVFEGSVATPSVTLPDVQPGDILTVRQISATVGPGLPAQLEI